jgi:undecaprenyl-diphosphatase
VSRASAVRGATIRAVLGLVAIAVLGVGLGRLVTGPAADVVARHVDGPARRFAEAHTRPSWHRLLTDVSVLGTAVVTGAVAIVTGAVFAIRRRDALLAFASIVAFAGAAVLVVTVKIGVHRYPASGAIPNLTSGTFPSGHALFAASVYGMLAVVVARSAAPAVIRAIAAAALVALALLVGWTRVFLLDHYLSDVLGSLVLGGLWVAVVADGARRVARSA